METIDIEKKYELQPFVEVVPYSKIKEKDVLILRCEKGKENEAISKINNTLRILIEEKDLRILALTPDFNLDDLSMAVQITSQWEVKEEDE
jgi:hypothetical protein